MRLSVLLCIVCSFSCRQSALAQVVVNPGFENGSLAGWSVYIPGTGSAVVGSTAHSGTYGLTEGPIARLILRTKISRGLHLGKHTWYRFG